MRRLDYPEFLLSICVLVEDRLALTTGSKKSKDSILVRCQQCGLEYNVRVHDIYRRKYNPDGFYKPLICSSCSHKNSPSGIVRKLMEKKQEGEKNG